MKRWFFLAPLCAGLLIGLLNTSAWAGGFHYTIGASSRFLADEQGHLTAVQMSWLHDEVVSGLLLDGQGTDEAALQSLSDSIIKDLAGLDYFTLLRVDGETVKTGMATQHRLQLMDNKLWLSFTLPLVQAQNISGKVVQMTLQDKNGSADLSHADVDSVELGATLQPQCKTALKPLEAEYHGAASQLVQVICR